MPWTIQSVAMPDDKTKRGGQDRGRVSSMESYEIKYRAQKHGVTQKAVKEAVQKIGASRTKLAAQLRWALPRRSSPYIPFDRE